MSWSLMNLKNLRSLWNPSFSASFSHSFSHLILCSLQLFVSATFSTAGCGTFSARTFYRF